MKLIARGSLIELVTLEVLLRNKLYGALASTLAEIVFASILIIRWSTVVITPDPNTRQR